MVRGKQKNPFGSATPSRNLVTDNEPRKRGVLAFAVSAALLPTVWSLPAYAGATAPNTLPTNGVYTSGTGSIALTNPSTLQVTQGTNKGIIEWGSFSIGSNGWVNFTQPSASSITLNRVLGPDPSSIFGRLTANGQIFLTNPRSEERRVGKECRL